jgi:hypothetical protein
MTHEMALQFALDAFRHSVEGTAHLRTRIILNRTAIPFFMSDDPVVYTNRFHLQKDVLGGLPTIYQAGFSAFDEALKVLPALSMAHATLSNRSATDRRARPWL